MPAQTHIRPAVPSDRGALMPLFSELNQHHAAIQPGYFRVLEGVAPALQRLEDGDEDMALLVAEREGTLKGFVVVRVHDTPDNPLLVKRRRAHVEDMLVTAAARRQGIGRALVEAAAQWSRERGASRVLLTVWQDNDDAEAFYRDLGFGPLNRVLEREL